MTTSLFDLSIASCALMFLLGMVSLTAGAGTAHAESVKTSDEIKKEAEAAKSVADAETAKFNAEKAKAEAEQAAFKAKFGNVPESGYSGTAEINSNAGKSEAAMLSAVTLNQIGQVFAEKINNKTTLPAIYLLCTDAAQAEFKAHERFNAQVRMMEMQKDKLLESKEEVQEGKGLPVAAVGMGLDAVNKILAFAKTDYKFYNLEITADDTMLLNAFAERLLSRVNQKQDQGLPDRVVIPGLYQASDAIAASEIMKTISDVSKWSDELKREIEGKKGNIKALESLKSGMDAWVAAQVTPDDKGKTEIDIIIAEQKIRRIIDGSDNAYIVILKIHNSSGTAYTKKHLFTSLGRNPFHIMGGSVASYSMFNAKTGDLVSSMLLPVHGGYHSVSKLEKYIKEQTMP